MTNIKLQQKIMKGREMFEQMEVKKSGYNKFHKFKYYELDDLLPPHKYICNQLKIYSRLDRSDESMAKYIITDMEQGDDQVTETYYAPTCEVLNSNVTQGQQEKGSVQKYAHRYLLIQLWEISEGDTIDAGKTGLNTKITIPPERIKELTAHIGDTIYKQGGNNNNKKELMDELNKEFKAKEITSQEYEEVKKVIFNMKQ